MLLARFSESNHSPSGRKEFAMKTLFVLATLVMLGSALIGCRAEAAVGDKASSNVSVPR